MDSEHLYRNPFADFNANVMKSDRILSLWCSPFEFAKAPVTEADVYQLEMPIVFMGGRGTGKTMFLKYFSYETQRDEALRQQNQSRYPIFDYIRQRGGVGFYLRLDGPVLRSFSGKGLSAEQWDSIFTQYFELQICKEYLDVIADLVARRELDERAIEARFIPEITRLLEAPLDSVRKIGELQALVASRIKEVTDFRADVAFSDISFVPTKAYGSQDLSYAVADIVKAQIEEFSNGVNFVLLVDEYENFMGNQQRIVNTLMKFVRPGITFRIGMRLKGFHTFDTITENEFIKENRDYICIVLEDILIWERSEKSYKKFLRTVAQKRLESVPALQQAGFTDIYQFLGFREDLEEEARALVKEHSNPTMHFGLLRFSKQNTSTTIALLRCEENPLLEMLNILWCIRGIGAEAINRTMHDYLAGKKTESVTKYRRDYVDKYKLSLMILLASEYKTHKKYYSFNTFCYLSSGIIGNFIELCRRAFQQAYFEQRIELMETGKIDIDVQDRAARGVASTELEMCWRVPTHGDMLHRFAINVGNIFRHYHQDPFVRYPETNQLAMDLSTADQDTRNTIESAERWSVIQRKPALQQRTLGDSDRAELYTLNRTLAPLFDLTYRTRGGYSEECDSEHAHALLTAEEVGPRKDLGIRMQKSDQGQGILDFGQKGRSQGRE